MLYLKIKKDTFNTTSVKNINNQREREREREMVDFMVWQPLLGDLMSKSSFTVSSH